MSKTFIIPIRSDTHTEADETVELTLGAPSGGANLGAVSTGLLTIRDVPGSAPFPVVTNPAPVLATSDHLLVLMSGGVRRTRRGRFRQTVRLLNAGRGPVAGPVTLVLNDLPSGVLLARSSSGIIHAHGVRGQAHVLLDLPANTYDSLGGVPLVLEFSNPRQRKIRYSLSVLS